MQPPTQDKELSILSYLFQSAASDHDVYHKITDFFPALEYVYDPLTNKLVYVNKKDNDIGFEPEYADKIFQIFQRLHGKVEYPGSGVGLAICKKIIERHGGLIFATSTPDQCSVFTTILPKKQL